MTMSLQKLQLVFEHEPNPHMEPPQHTTFGKLPFWCSQPFCTRCENDFRWSAANGISTFLDTFFFFCKNTPSMFSYPQFSGPEVESVCRSLHFKPQIKPDVHVAGSQASRSEQKAARPSPFPFPQLTPFPRCPQVARFSNASQHLKILCRDATVLKTHRSETFTRPAEQHLASATAMGHKMWDWKNAKGSENF